ncbi:Bifunctional D-glycero-beta-D-manno-heptose-7-phosphate kinase/D-glycero-beta-D-manno-heptose 1-phosphate adenylyltransferase HldE [Planctomycetales bacterium 10988]|nr:Bifunctional D-glycero-beta-D-manno-heptose-7-phosphate kinase/D-glycero-beta-D-manno-heptose 1-phosphate adenylyltransferase HldE [Planctomycetales bacterium 10988]
MSQETLQLFHLLERMGQPRVLVLGDLILDRYTWGDAERVSQEAPVLVMRANRQESRLGGSASVCRLLRGLEAEVTSLGVVGEDADGEELRSLLAQAGVDQEHVLIDPSRPTTTKERFIGLAQNRHPHQILRVDREERTDIHRELEEQFLARLISLIDQHQVVLISDYDKGVCTPWLLKQVMDVAKQANVPVLVDPIRSKDYSKYRGASAMTPNRLEAQLATGQHIGQPRDAFLLGKQLCEELDLKAAIITLDRDGMALVPPDGGGTIYPTRPRNVYDITGAGDMVLAMMGLCVACGIKLSQSIQLANVAGGLEVEKVGVVPVSRDEIRGDLEKAFKAPLGKIMSLDEAKTFSRQQQQQNKKVVFTNGCFDLLHVGHTTYLQEAAEMGDLLLVGLNSDASVRRLKGSGRPINEEHSRASVLASLACVDGVVIFDEDTPAELIQAIRPDVLTKGGSYDPDTIVGADFVKSYGGTVCITGFVEGMSSTNLLAKSQQKHTSLPGPHFQRMKERSLELIDSEGEELFTPDEEA